MDFKHPAHRSAEKFLARQRPVSKTDRGQAWHFGAKKYSLIIPAVFGFVAMHSGLSNTVASDSRAGWSATDLLAIKFQAFTNLPRLQKAPSNLVADNPLAAALGKALFFDARFSANGAVSCASCHKPDRQFQDDLRLARGIAQAGRRTMSLAGTAFHPFLFWDGRKDSLWSQAPGPLENPAEHGADRTMIARLIAANYRADYETLFGTLPDFGEFPAHATPTGSPETIKAWMTLTAEQQRAAIWCLPTWARRSKPLSEPSQCLTRGLTDMLRQWKQRTWWR
jgi:hypothetical protein